MRGSLAYAFPHSQAIGADDPQMDQECPAYVPLRSKRAIHGRLGGVSGYSRGIARSRRAPRVGDLPRVDPDPNPARGNHAAMIHARVVRW
jgi:hypothetical protein